MLLTTDDFINKWELSTGMYDTNKITSYIRMYEEKYLVHLLGADLYKEFIGDIANNVPQSPNFIKIFNAFNQDLNTLTPFYGTGVTFGHGLNRILESDGILDMLKGFIYWEYARDLLNQQTPYGGVKQMSENSIVVDTPHSLFWERYNEAIKTYQAIQEYIYINQSPSMGQIVSYTSTSGSGYSDGDANLIGGSGSGAVATLTTAPGTGQITGLVIKSSGLNYVVGDVLTIDGGNSDATLTLTYVGVGDYSKWNGTEKITAYWI